MNRTRLDALLLAALGVLAVVGAIVSLPDVLRLVVGVPLVLVGPGYGLQRCLVGRSAQIGWADRAILTVVGSLAVTIALALLLQLTPRGIGSGPALLVLGGLCLILGALIQGLQRDGERRAPVRPSLAMAPYAIALLLGIGAAGYGLERSFEPAARADAGLDATLLAGLPTTGGVRLDVESAERARTAYALRILVADAQVIELTFELEPGERWSRIVTLPDGPVEVQLFRATDLRSPYRSLLLRREA